MRFRKKPVTVEAIQWTGENWREVLEFGPGVVRSVHFGPGNAALEDEPHHLRIETLEGSMVAKLGDWILKGVAGEFYPCKPDIFAATYEVRAVGVAMTLELPYPPSANRYWRKTNRGQLYPSEEAKAFKAAVLRQLRGKHELMTGPVAVFVQVYRPQKSGDLDNTLKVLLDSLKGLAFVDDKQVVRIVADRHDDKANPRAVVTIEAAQGEAG